LQRQRLCCEKAIKGIAMVKRQKSSSAGMRNRDRQLRKYGAIQRILQLINKRQRGDFSSFNLMATSQATAAEMRTLFPESSMINLALGDRRSGSIIDHTRM
jgi:hypothetical protein